MIGKGVSRVSEKESANDSEKSRIWSTEQSELRWPSIKEEETAIELSTIAQLSLYLSFSLHHELLIVSLSACYNAEWTNQMTAGFQFYIPYWIIHDDANR